MSSEGSMQECRRPFYARRQCSPAPRPGGLLLCYSRFCYMRLFVALDIDDAIRERIAAFVEQHRSRAPKARWVSRESLHVTLKFIGEKPDAMVADIHGALSSVNSAPFE